MGEGEESGTGGGSRSAIVAGGILVSRLTGFARQRAVAYFFGTGPHADVFTFALRAPNILQNLLGEGTLSASFIPIYSRMLEEGREREAGRFAGAIFGLLLAVAGGLALLGVLLAEPIVAVLAAGFLEDTGGVDRFPLAVTAVRITFPMTGVLVLHAWALGILNSHRRFFLPYVAPALWNGTIIGALVLAGQLLVSGSLVEQSLGTLSLATLDRLLVAACFGALVGGGVQFGVQLPLVLRLLRGFRVSLSTRVEGVRQALRSFWPVVSGRGVVQLGAWFDLFLASFLVDGAVSALGFAQTLYLLPISLFAMSVAAAELPELSRSLGAAPARSGGKSGETARIDRSMRQIALLVVPTAVGYLVFGYLIVGAIFRTGSFGPASNMLVYAILAVYAVGLVASAGSRLLQNVFFALGDTRTPARLAAQRVFVAAAVAVPVMLALDRVDVPVGLSLGHFGSSLPGGTGTSDPGLRFGAVGLAAGSAVGAWYEIVRLFRDVRRRLEAVRAPWEAIGRMVGAAAVAVVPATLLWWASGRVVQGLHPALEALIVVGVYAGLYLAAARVLGFPEVETWLGRIARRFRSR